jgi:diaminopimelate decarboxylase
MKCNTHGVAALQARQEPWMKDLLQQPEVCAELLAEFGSPVNVMRFDAVAHNAQELVDAARHRSVDAKVFVARKANKSLGLVDAVKSAGLGMDVASFNELRQCLDRGLAAEALILSAAVKSEPLLRMAVRAGVAISVDNLDELDDISRITDDTGQHARVALRLAVAHEQIAPTRFGLTHGDWLAAAPQVPDSVVIEGLHFHLNGYSAAERAIALRQACELVDQLRGLGHPVQWIDMGGGVPVSYLTDEHQWRTFWSQLAEHTGAVPQSSQITWRGDRLGMTDPLADRPSASVYPFWQATTRGQWLGDVLDDRDPGGHSVAHELVSRGLTLHLEPGRAMLDGCGVTLARVAFCKASSDAIGLVGLHMNRTQVRSTSADFMCDPVQLRPPGARAPHSIESGFLVGAYCIEEELLLRRRLVFGDGVSRDDIFAFVNTGGYLMHIVESPSHQLGLAANVVWTADGWARDAIDAPPQ